MVGEAHPYEDKDEHRDKVICSGDGVLVGQTQEVHDGGTHTQYTLHFVSRGLVGVDGLDLSLRGGPRSLPQIDLQAHKPNIVELLYGQLLFFYKSFIPCI